MKLSNIRLMGRYINPETNRAVNIYIGRRVGKSTELLFYYFRQKRIWVSMGSFYSGNWKKEPFNPNKPILSNLG